MNCSHRNFRRFFPPARLIDLQDALVVGQTDITSSYNAIAPTTGQVSEIDGAMLLVIAGTAV